MNESQVLERIRENWLRGCFATSIAYLCLAFANGSNSPAATLSQTAIALGDQHFNDRHYELANDAYTKAIALDPKNRHVWGRRAACNAALGNVERANSDFRKALKLDETDAANRYVPSHGRKLSPADLKHGEVQLCQMLVDRAEMARIVKKGDPIWTWTARKFAGEDLEDTIDWNSSTPDLTVADASHVIPTPDERGAVWVSSHSRGGETKDEQRSFEQLWADAIFELHNIANVKPFKRIEEQVKRDELTPDKYVASMAKVEYSAVQRTRAFYFTVFLPWATKQRIDTDPTLWWTEHWPDADCWFASFQDRTKYPWYPFELRYILLRAPRVLDDDRQYTELVRFTIKRLADSKNPKETATLRHCLVWLALQSKVERIVEE